MTEQNQSGRSRRLSAKNESPWPEDFLSRLNLEQDALRKKVRREVRPLRRRLARKAAGEC